MSKIRQEHTYKVYIISQIKIECAHFSKYVISNMALSHETVKPIKIERQFRCNDSGSRRILAQQPYRKMQLLPFDRFVR